MTVVGLAGAAYSAGGAEKNRMTNTARVRAAGAQATRAANAHHAALAGTNHRLSPHQGTVDRAKVGNELVNEGSPHGLPAKFAAAVLLGQVSTTGALMWQASTLPPQ